MVDVFSRTCWRSRDMNTSLCVINKERCKALQGYEYWLALRIAARYKCLLYILSWGHRDGSVPDATASFGNGRMVY